MHYLPSWWLNQPIWKICSSKWESSPNRDEHQKYNLKPQPTCRVSSINLLTGGVCTNLSFTGFLLIPGAAGFLNHQQFVESACVADLKRFQKMCVPQIRMNPMIETMKLYKYLHSQGEAWPRWRGGHFFHPSFREEIWGYTDTVSESIQKGTTDSNLRSFPGWK